MTRIATLALTLILALLGSAVAANAATYYVDNFGSDSNPCTQAQPCKTIAQALVQHRVAPQPDDVISVGAGVFVGNVDATDADDDGLTIQGALDNDGSRLTTIRAQGSGTSACSAGECGVALGVTPDTNVTLKDANVDTEGADDEVDPIGAAGGSDLSNLSVQAKQDSNAFEIVSVEDNGTTVDHTTIDASGTFAEGLFFTDDVAATDSVVIGGDFSPAVDQCGCSGGAASFTRAWVQSTAGYSGPIVITEGDLTLDSSLITGGDPAAFPAGAVYAGAGDHTWTVRSTTIDVGKPGVADQAAVDLFVGTGSGRIDLTVNSALLAEAIFTYPGGPDPAEGSIGCTNSDLHGVDADPGMTVDCAVGSNGNTTRDPKNQFVGGSPFSWALKDGAPAIDKGDPGPLAPGQSTTDLAGNPRIEPGTPATCPDGVRDQGAYEHAPLSCIPQLVRPPVIKDSSAPVAGVKLGSNPGAWAPPAASYSREWLRCVPSDPDDCTPIAGKTHNTYIPTNDDAGFVLRLRVVATNSVGSSTPATSAPTGIVAASVPVVQQPPSIQGADPPTVGSVLSGHRGSWLPVPDSYSRQWLRCDAGNPSNCASIPGATGTRYRAQPADAGARIKLQVVAHNSEGDSQPAVSAPTSVVP